MSMQQSFVVPINVFEYSNGVFFYWTVFNRQEPEPLIKYGDIFHQVHTDRTQILLMVKLLAIAELRMKDENQYIPQKPEMVVGKLRKLTYSNTQNFCGEIVFGDNDTDFQHFHDMVKSELIRLVSQH